MSSAELLQQGIAAYKAGRTQEARNLLARAVDQDPDNEAAWLWLSGVVESDEERLVCLEEVLVLNPANAMAQRGVAHLRAQGVQAPPPVTEPSPPSGIQPFSASPSEPEPDPLDALFLGAAASALEPEQPLYLEAEEPAPVPAPEPAPVPTPEPAPVPTPELAPVAEQPLYLEAEEPEQVPDPEAAAPEPASSETETKKDQDDMSAASFWVAVAGLGVALVCVVGLLLYVLFGPGIELPGTRPTESPSAITAVIYEQLAAHNAEDIDRYLATMHSDAEGLDEMRSALADMYRTYDLNTRVYDLEVVKANSREARVAFVLVTRKIRGPAFRDNRIEGEFILRKDEGRWKLYRQDIDDIEYLE